MKEIIKDINNKIIQKQVKKLGIRKMKVNVKIKKLKRKKVNIIKH
jgi:hypothetical protein